MCFRTDNKIIYYLNCVSVGSICGVEFYINYNTLRMVDLHTPTYCLLYVSWKILIYKYRGLLIYEQQLFKHLKS